MMQNNSSDPKGNPWADWLADDPLPVSSDSPRVHRPAQLTPAEASSPQEATVSIQIALPKFRLPKLPYKRIGMYAAIAVATGAVLIGSVLTAKHFLQKRKAAVKGVSTGAPLSFTPVAPKDKPQLAQGGNTDNTAYDPQRRLYSFSDTLMGFGVTVSQQELPDSFKKDPNSLKKAADSMEGKIMSIETAFGPAYISSSSKGEAQRVVFIYLDRMVFLASYKNFDNDTWKYYIETLR